jgi:DNA replication and repair protein RecF
VQVRWLTLSAFRGYASLSFAPDPGLNVLIGPNGQGKTSLLEAVHVLLTGRSFRTPRMAECVAWGAAEAGVRGEVAREGQRRELSWKVTARGSAGGAREPCPWARAVSFSAGDLGLLTGGPPYRRAYLDGTAAKLYPAHGETCRRYRLVLAQRARLLGQLVGRADADRLLGPWDEQVAALGSEIVHRRLDTLATVAGDVRDVWHALAPAGERLALEYAPRLAPGDDAAATRQRLRAALGTGRAAEVARGITLVGPHRDDLTVNLGTADARVYASRGEQRLAALALRLGEATAVRRRLGVPPVLLLDDLLSELDLGARERVLAWLRTQGQVLFSTTDAAPGTGGHGVAWDVRGGAVDALEVSVAGDAA